MEKRNNKATMAEILSRLDKLEKDNAELRRENAELRKNNLKHNRILIDDICNPSKARDLFNLVPDNNGNIIQSADNFKSNFGVFYQNIFRALNPSVRRYNGRRTLTYTPINELTDNEYDIHIKVLEDVLEVVHHYKKKLKEVDKED